MTRVRVKVRVRSLVNGTVLYETYLSDYIRNYFKIRCSYATKYRL